MIKDYPRDKDGNRISFRQVIKEYGYPLISKGVSRAISDVRNIGNSCYAASCFGISGSCSKSQTGLFNYSKYKYLIESPFKISNKCCDIMKKKPAHQFEKQSGLKSIVATMTCESVLRKNAWLKNGCNAFNAKRQTSQPMSFWTEQDVLKYIKENNLPLASVYGEIKQDDKGNYYTTGVNRTGCVFCCYGCHREKEPNRFQQLKETHPKLYEYCMRDWEDGGLGLKDVLNYINVKY